MNGPKPGTPCAGGGDGAALVERARGGDPTAFAQLVEQYRPAVVRTARALLANHHDAEEVAQETLLQAWRELSSLRHPSRFPAWLYRITRTRSSNFRTRWRQETLPIDGIDWSGAGAIHGDGSESRSVQEAIGALSEVNRLAARLFYLDGYTVDEIAALLAVPPGTVKRRLHDARGRLKDRLPELARGRGTRRERAHAKERWTDMDATSLGSGRELAVAAGTLRAALRRATRAAARDGRHPALRAILARQTEDGVTVAAADGFRIVNVALAGAAVRARFAGGEARALLLPVRVADAVMALLEDLGEREAVRFEPAADGRRVSITAGDVRLQAPLGEGTLPDAVQAIPPGWQEWRTRIRVETAALRGALQTVGRASFARIPLLLDPETDQVRYSQRGTDAPKALHGTISAAHEGARQRVALNGEYLLDILEAATGSHVVLSWGDPLKPITIREVAAAGEEGGASVTWAVMPMRAAELEPEYAAA